MSASAESYDLVVLGGGPGGYVAAIRGGQLNGKVALIEEAGLGGVCLQRGCVPTKFLLEMAGSLKTMQGWLDSGLFHGRIEPSLSSVMERKDAVIKRLEKGIEYLLKKNKVHVIRGRGKLIGPNILEVTDRGGEKTQIGARNVIVATGSRPLTPQIPGLDEEGVITGEELLDLNEFPKNVVIIGGGPEGVEFAHILHAFGSKVTVVEMLRQLLPMEDTEIGIELEKTMSRAGIQVKTGSKVVEVVGPVLQKKIRLSTDKSIEETEELEADAVLLAAGRVPNIEGIGLDEMKIRHTRRGIEVDTRMMTNLPGIYAIGDVAGRFWLAYTASEEGIVASENAMGLTSVAEHRVLPRCVFTKPEVGAVGLTEQQAKSNGTAVKVGRYSFFANAKGVSTNHNEGLIKIVAEEGSGLVLGVHILGPDAAELVHAAALGMFMNVTLDNLSDMLFAHPTYSEGLREAALDALGKAIHK